MSRSGRVWRPVEFKLLGVVAVDEICRDLRTIWGGLGGVLLREEIHHSGHSDNGSFIRRRGVLLETNEANLPSPPGTSQA